MDVRIVGRNHRLSRHKQNALRHQPTINPSQDVGGDVMRIKAILAALLLTASLSGCTAPAHTDTTTHTVSASLTATHSIFANSDTTYATLTAEDGTVYTIDTARYSIDTAAGDYIITYALTPSDCGCCEDTVNIISVRAE